MKEYFLVAIADRDEAVTARRVFVGARGAARHQTEDHVASFAGPLRGAPGDGELGVVGMRLDAEDPPEGLR